MGSGELALVVNTKAKFQTLLCVAFRPNNFTKLSLHRDGMAFYFLSLCLLRRKNGKLDSVSLLLKHGMECRVESMLLRKLLKDEKTMMRVQVKRF